MDKLQLKDLLKNKETKLFAICCFLGGIIVGFLIAPIKQGISCGNNNGNTYGNDVDELDYEEEF